MLHTSRRVGIGLIEVTSEVGDLSGVDYIVHTWQSLIASHKDVERAISIVVGAHCTVSWQHDATSA